MKILEPSAYVASFPSETDLASHLASNPCVRLVSRAILQRTAKGEQIVVLSLHATPTEAAEAVQQASIRDALAEATYLRPKPNGVTRLTLPEKRIRRSSRRLGFSKEEIAKRIADHRRENPPTPADLI